VSLIEFEDGLVVDEATGEIIEQGAATLVSMVDRLATAKAQVNAHERDVRALTQVLLGKRIERGVYGDWTAQPRTEDTYPKLNRQRFALWLTGDEHDDIPAAELTREDLVLLLLAVNAFEAKSVRDLPDHLKEPIEDFIEHYKKAAWIDTRPVKRAPGRTKEEVMA
jgi:hypothetical protein